MAAKYKTQERKRKLRSILSQRWREQGQRCLWCGEWVWLRSYFGAKEAANYILMTTNKSLDAAQVELRSATAEHIIPRAQGGNDAPINIACACSGCNNERGNDLRAFKPDWRVVDALPRGIKRKIYEIYKPTY